MMPSLTSPLVRGLMVGSWVGDGGLPSSFLVGSVGNSFQTGEHYSYVSFSNEMNALASATGLDLWCGQHAVSNYTWANHVADATCETFIASRVWTDFVLQGHTAAMQPANRAGSISSALTLVGRILAASPKARLWLWQTPKTPVTDLADVVDGYEELRSAIFAAHPGARVEIIRQGEGFYYAGCDLPNGHPFKPDWRMPDDLHPDENGSAFTTLLVWNTITRRATAGLLNSAQYLALGKAITASKSDLELRASRWRLGFSPVIIETGPASMTAPPGTPASFTVSVISRGAVSYQWRKNGVAIPGATASQYDIASADVADHGAQFTCACSNSEGTVVSAAATLSVATPIVPVYVNLTRAVGAGGDITYPGGDAVNRWNNINAIGDNDLGTVNATWALVDKNGSATGIVLELLAEGTGIHASGATGILGLPNAATQISWIGDGVTVNRWRFKGLTPSRVYRFRTGGFRNSATVRTTRHAWTGATSGFTDYNAGTNLSALAEYSVAADASGYVTIEASSVAPTDSAFHYTGLFILDTP